MDRTNEESIVPGCSLARTVTELNKKYNIVCGIVVQNKTNMDLSLPHATINTGCLINPPASVSPGQIEYVIARKYGYSLKGTSGLISWFLSELGRRVVVMWNVPFFQSANVLAVGITTQDNTMHNRIWYTKMERSSHSTDIHFQQEIYYDTCKEVMITEGGIQVLGTMGTGRTPEVKITVRPKRQ